MLRGKDEGSYKFINEKFWFLYLRYLLLGEEKDKNEL